MSLLVGENAPQACPNGSVTCVSPDAPCPACESAYWQDNADVVASHICTDPRACAFCLSQVR